MPDGGEWGTESGDSTAVGSPRNASADSFGEDSSIPGTHAPLLLVAHLGTMPYAGALELQREVARKRIAGSIAHDVLLLVEHPPVVTLGRASKAAHLIASREVFAARGVELFEVERGGDVTFHGPGQLVGYPIIDLKRHRQDLHWYLRSVEEALIRALRDTGVRAERFPGRTGVWTEASPVANGFASSSNGEHERSDAERAPRRKLASIGVHARDWVTWHGFALNVSTDLRYFDLIVPCGIQNVTMTSVARELEAGSVDVQDVATHVIRAFGSVFALEPRVVELEMFLRHADSSSSSSSPASHDSTAPGRRTVNRA